MSRLALVTGGQRRLGAAIAERLAAAGYRLALHSGHGAPDPAVAALIASGAAAGFVADFADPAAPAALLDAVGAHFGGAPDLLVNNAAIFGDDRIDTLGAGSLARHHAINLAAPVLLTQRFAARARARGGAVVNILDQRIAAPHGDQTSYTLSKLGLAGFTAIAAQALAPAIRVNAVAPGLVLPTGDYAPGQMDAVAALMPLKRLPTPQHIAEAVRFLADTPGLSGQTLFVDGGAHLRAYPADFVNLAA